MQKKHDLLKTYFGYPEFRQGQADVIDALLAGRDALAIMPTGAGKSVCYQIPALLLSGITVVVSPLVSLMNDQVMALVQMGIPAAYLNRSLTAKQYQTAMSRAREGRYKLIYVAPERLFTPEFQSFCQNTQISMVAVDEAHCISQWGQDFRPSYLDIPAFVAALPQRPVVGAFTATATPKVRRDIETTLALQDPFTVTTGFDRPKLYFEVRQTGTKRVDLLEIVRKYERECGIVYCATRKGVEEVCDFLQEQGFSATRYHAGLAQEDRRANQEDFQFDRKQIMVATNAFGMGIDKSNVRYVVHYNMPKDLESYYQEAGRAGRDGEAANCILLYNGQDVRTNEFLISNSDAGEVLDEETARKVRQRDMERLRQMTFYCHSHSCLRQYILHYFGEKTTDYCGNCHICVSEFEEVDITADARAILGCVMRTQERFGISLIADVLRGSESEKIERYGLQTQRAYGILKHLSQKEVQQRIRFLIERGYLAQSPGEYPVLTLGAHSDDLLREEETLTMRAVKVQQTRRKPSNQAQELDARQAALFERLRTLRATLAKRQGVPAFVIFTDKTLHDMCIRMPRRPEQLQEVGGVGSHKTQQYGTAFLQEIDTYLQETGGAE